MAFNWLEASVFLVMCTRRKREEPAAARELYTSPFFASARRLVERAGTRWYILSGEHGLLDPTTVVRPYDRHLGHCPREVREAWARRVHAALHARLAVGDRITLLADAVYGEFLVPFLREAGYEVEEPLASLGPEGFVPFLDDAISHATRD